MYSARASASLSFNLLCFVGLLYRLSVAGLSHLYIVVTNVLLVVCLTRPAAVLLS